MSTLSIHTNKNWSLVDTTERVQNKLCMTIVRRPHVNYPTKSYTVNLDKCTFKHRHVELQL